ncbi:hypothetical protein SCLCIDRAFT_38914, partial [Scleroderma citrinum Foug A]
MPRAKKNIACIRKTSFCPDCGKWFANKTNVLRHMNQPSSACSSFINFWNSHRPYAGSRIVQESDLFNEDQPDLQEEIPEWECDGVDFNMRDDASTGTPFPEAPSNVEYYPGASSTYGQGTTFISEFFNDKYAHLRHENIFYPFASQEDWQLGSWLLRSGLSMAAIDSFLSLELIKQISLSFRSARELRLHMEMLPPGPSWKCHTINPPAPTKRPIALFYRNAIDCIQSLLSHPFFERHILFVPRKVWSTAARVIRVYNEWLTGDHAWELQSELPDGATLLGIVLSSDKTNISVMSGNRMAHPLLLSLANIDADIRSKSSLRTFLLLALLPVPSFVHNKSRVRGLLSDRLVHQCLDLVLKPLKIAAAVGVMMSDPVGNLHHCYTPLVAYIADTPEQSLIACTSPKTSPVSTAIYKQFGDGICHPPRTAAATLHVIKIMCMKSLPTDLINFLKVAKEHRLNGVFEPFWRDWLHSDPSRFLLLEVLHHLHRFSFDHDLQWCIAVVGNKELDYQFTLTR